jgi:PPOX class probable F420-dependent enzyme
MTDTASTPFTLSDDLRAFLARDLFATIATIDPDGAPRQAVIWYTLEGDELVINSAVGRRWPANLLRDQRISMAIPDQHDGYRWVGLTGTVSVVRDQPTAQADIAAMARRYHADEPDEAERLIRDRFERQERISFRVRIESLHDHLD